jgi:hypothetical protein
MNRSTSVCRSEPVRMIDRGARLHRDTPS